MRDRGWQISETNRLVETGGGREREKKEKETKQFELGLFEFESRIIRKDNFSIEKKKERGKEKEREKKKNGLESR